MNKYLFISFTLGLFLVSGSAGFAQDLGIPDTVKLEGGPLVENQSVPLTLTIVNDYSVCSYTLGFEAISIDDGFAIYDSIVYLNRMADPAIISYRNINLYDNDGTPPDSILIGGMAISLCLPPGNDPVALVYYSGLITGQMSIDSAFLPAAASFLLVNNLFQTYTPEFVTEYFNVIEGNPLPEITLSEKSPQLAVGDNVTFSVSGSSPDNFPIGLELISLVGYEDESHEPSGEPSFGVGNPAEFSWTPESSDIGIWEATFRVTDSSGQYADAITDIQVVENSTYLVGFGYSVLVDVGQSYGIHHGNFDDDAYPEIFSCGNGFLDVPQIELFEYSEEGGISRVFSMYDGFSRAGPQVGYFDGDNYLDGLVIRQAHSASTVEIWHGNGDNTLTVSTEASCTGFLHGSCLGEFTGDGYLDYATVKSSEVTIYDGSTSPAFEVIHSFNISGTSKAINSADFNNDGYDDLAVGMVTGVRIYLNNGTGGFTAGAFYSQTFGAVDIVVTNEGSDFNGDGNFDLCISTPSVAGEYSQMVIYLGNGDGTFDRDVIRNPKGQIFGNCVGDFNNDGKLDVACVNGARQYAAVLFGNGDGTFTNELRYWIDSRKPERIDECDIDLDGDLDMVVVTNGLLPSNDIILFSNQLDPEQYEKRSLSIESLNNAEISLMSPDGRVFNRMRNTIPGSDYFRRNLDADEIIDEYAVFELVAEGAYHLSVSPKPNLTTGEQFTMEFTLDGELYRLAKDIPMSVTEYQFTVYAAEQSEILPRPGKFVQVNPPAFMWIGEGDFDFQLASDINFETILYDVDVTGNFYTLPSPLSLTEVDIFYWRVKQDGEASYDCLYAINVLSGSSGFCGDANSDGGLNVADVVYLINMVFKGGPEPDPFCKGDANGDGAADVGDAVYMISYVFRGGSAPTENCCP